MPFWCYIVRCADGRYYTGHTDLLERRIAQHNAGGYCKFTSTRRPVELVWCQEFPTRLEALEAERRISPWSRKKKEALIASDWDALSFWAKKPSERFGATVGDGVSTTLDTNGGGDDAPTPAHPERSRGTTTGEAHSSVRPERSRGINPDGTNTADNSVRAEQSRDTQP